MLLVPAGKGTFLCGGGKFGNTISAVRWKRKSTQWSSPGESPAEYWRWHLASSYYLWLKYKRDELCNKLLKIKRLGASEFKNKTVSHSQPLSMTIDLQIKKWLQNKDWIQNWMIKLSNTSEISKAIPHRNIQTYKSPSNKLQYISQILFLIMRF